MDVMVEVVTTSTSSSQVTAAGYCEGPPARHGLVEDAATALASMGAPCASAAIARDALGDRRFLLLTVPAV